MLVALYWRLLTPNFFILFNTVILLTPSVPAAWGGLPPASLKVTTARSTLLRANC